MRYSNNANNRDTLRQALVYWFNRARQVDLEEDDAWLQLHPNGTLFYNCGGINPAGGGGYGRDYVDQDLFDWFEQQVQQRNYQVAGPTARPFGPVGVGGYHQYEQDYYTITYRVLNNYQFPGGIDGIPAGAYSVTLNFHVYVGPRQNNPHYQPLPPAQPYDVAFPPLPGQQ